MGSNKLTNKSVRRIIRIGIVAVLGLLSISAGIPKIVRMPQEVQLFADIGGNLTLLTAQGFIQVIGALLLAMRSSRRSGAAVVALGFLGSSAILFLTGQLGFGLFSLLPIAAASYILFVKD